MNNANTTRLFKEFGTKIGHHQYERYWDEIVQIILATEGGILRSHLRENRQLFGKAARGFSTLYFTHGEIAVSPS
jgi:hypothetical protein